MRSFLVMLAVLMYLGGCQSHSANRVEVNLPDRDIDGARRLILEGNAALRKGDLDEAERAYRAALDADAFSGVAHNNLGKVHYHRHELYRAAQAFQYAAKLLPRRGEPQNNLGLVLEAAGKLDEAVTQYARAVEAEPGNPHLLGNLARARIRRGDEDAETMRILSDLVLRERRPAWLAWAKRQLARLGELPEATADVVDLAEGADL